MTVKYNAPPDPPSNGPSESVAFARAFAYQRRMGDSSASRHYLVTGGCGFIGRHLCRLLLVQGHRVTAYDNLSTGRREALPEGAALIIGDVGDAAILAPLVQQVDGCFHLAAVASVVRSTEAWAESHRTNVTGAIHVFEAARQNKTPIVYASSAAVYGQSDALPLNEDARTLPISAYGADKLGCELHGRVAATLHGIPTLGLRLFNVYGSGQSLDSMYSGVISLFIDRVLAGRVIGIHGAGSQTRDFIHVQDVCRHFLAAMDALHAGLPPEPVLNACTGQATSIKALASAVMQAAGREVDIETLPVRPGDIPASLGDPARAAGQLHLRAETSLIDGLAETIAAIRASRGNA